MSTSERLPYLDASLPEAWKSLNALALKVSAAAEAAGLERETLELMNVRISQINGCAFCLDLHTRKALDAGASQQRLALLPAWRESTLFDSVECAVLDVAEVTTTLPDPQQRGEALVAARRLLGDETFAAVEWAAVTMNAFNRVSILSEHPVRRRD
ncbi:carboxymuconolactone decarboxylase family protein [Janibacter terrae]|uniref:Carboxymuconolactone decarboxylase family protein n=1 Tax=Janibacter terrae TaxID=103817 RepID=A0ABZ2FGJ1_9MICO|nr:carboxymuconolactone decarboxylase family protein [Janibacter terrae]MBA4083550.1 carboxymuconolactone decarboxylase family protein [Kytococcus sp.]HBO53928.1 carboxymuconolactone decarboxylase family protein [Janibacter terrae]